MNNPFPELEPYVEAVNFTREDVERLLVKMEHDLRTAERNRGDAPDWAIAAAHQAIFDGCAALMATYGCRPLVNGHHVTALRFARLALPAHTTVLRRAERLRRQRHQAMYGTIGSVSLTDVDAAPQLARQITAILREAARRPGQGRGRIRGQPKLAAIGAWGL